MLTQSEVAVRGLKIGQEKEGKARTEASGGSDVGSGLIWAGSSVCSSMALELERSHAAGPVAKTVDAVTVASPNVSSGCGGGRTAVPACGEGSAITHGRHRLEDWLGAGSLLRWRLTKASFGVPRVHANGALLVVLVRSARGKLQYEAFNRPGGPCR